MRLRRNAVATVRSNCAYCLGIGELADAINGEIDKVYLVRPAPLQCQYGGSR